MPKARQKPSGNWEVTLRHPSLPGGRKAFTFDTEVEANNYAEQWRLMKLANIAPPTEMLKSTPKATVTLAHVVRAWMNSGDAAPTQQSPLGSLVIEVGSVFLRDASYTWLKSYIQRLKVAKNLTPSTIKHRIQALGRSIDEYKRHNPELVFQNPTSLLKEGYANYTEVDTKLAEASGGTFKENKFRDRRLHPGESEKIVAVLSGYQRDDKERALHLKGGNALLTMYLLILDSGLRLKEAYTLTRGQVDMHAKVIRAQNSKQWRGKVSFREVPMRPEAHTALAKYLSTRQILPNEYLFPFMQEEPNLPIKKVSQRLSSRFASAFEYAEIQDLHEHDLRHEATCRWLELKDTKGHWMFRLEEVNRIMGWANNSTMAQRYASFRGSDFAARVWAAEAESDVSSTLQAEV